ncbi:ABC transporter ATP-binding protein [Treponema primitia]|uniref:ABC transporter ATP-binding protein n=1 Tax=Treponema primitia TaxID=88058 RepID=UPI00025550C3|nr:ABC transporter ATP-binding protein [Treponema primitia]
MNLEQSSLRIFASYYRPHWKLFAADMFAASLIAAVDLSFPMMTKYTIEHFLPNSLYKFFFIMIAAMGIMYLLRMGFTYFITYWGHTVGVYLEADMRRDLFSHLQQLPFSFYDNHRTGHIMSRVTTDLFEVTELAHHGPEDLFISIITFVGSIFLVFSIRWEMALVLLVFVPFMIVHILRSRSNMMKTARKVKERTAEINAALESSISGVRIAKAFTNESYETTKFRGGNENYKTARKYYFRSMANFQSRLDFLLHILNVVVIAAGGFLIMKGRMTLPELIACNLFVAAFLQPIRRLQNFVEQYTTGMAGFNRFIEIMRIRSDIIDKDGAAALDKVRGDIEFADVSFSYNNNIMVLNHINLSVPAGKTIALVGPSGGGKTTLCHLLPRFYEIQKGSITVDGMDIRDITLESLRRNIGIVQQDVFLFAGTIRDNIKYGRIDATDDEVIAAAKRADIHDDIMKLSEGYDSLVGERGVKLSGGQKQRISIARIFLKNPPILILDEATSALDTATELRIQRALGELSRGRTTLVIAHRLSTIRNADSIAVITDDGIQQQGSHNELLAKGGIYAELYAAQFDSAKLRT